MACISLLAGRFSLVMEITISGFFYEKLFPPSRTTKSPGAAFNSAQRDSDGSHSLARPGILRPRHHGGTLAWSTVQAPLLQTRMKNER